MKITCAQNVFLDKLDKLCVYLFFHSSCFLYVTMLEKTWSKAIIPKIFQCYMKNWKLWKILKKNWKTLKKINYFSGFYAWKIWRMSTKQKKMKFFTESFISLKIFILCMAKILKNEKYWKLKNAEIIYNL